MEKYYKKVTLPKTTGEDFVQPKIPTLPPEKNVSKYLQSKSQNSKLCFYVNWDSLYPKPGSDLLKISRELRDIDGKLHNKRQAYFKTRVALNTEWNNLKEKQLTLKNNFIQFHEFVKENKEKRERGKRRINEAEQILKLKDEQIEEMKQNVEKMANVREKLENSVKGLQIFEDYLQDVCLITGEYASIPSVLRRFDTLSDGRTYLALKQKEAMECFEAQQNQMLKLIEERSAVIIGMTNTLVDLQNRYQETLGYARYWENVFYKTKSKCKREFLKIAVIKASTRNIYEQICKKKGVPVEINESDIEEMLHYIKVTINEYKKITRIALKKTALVKKQSMDVLLEPSEPRPVNVQK